MAKNLGQKLKEATDRLKSRVKVGREKAAEKTRDAAEKTRQKLKA